jgi:hypothetical protein
MMQWGTVVCPNASATTGAYYGVSAGNTNYADTPVTFPIQFIVAPSVSTGQYTNVVGSNPLSITSSGCTIRFTDNTSHLANTVSISYTAIGKWK